MIDVANPSGLKRKWRWDGPDLLTGRMIGEGPAGIVVACAARVFRGHCFYEEKNFRTKMFPDRISAQKWVEKQLSEKIR
jgi:hypothetical protein